jgi:hypothetical protein
MGRVSVRGEQRTMLVPAVVGQLASDPTSDQSRGVDPTAVCPQQSRLVG